MNLYAGTLGQLVIVELFVLLIWIKVLLAAMKSDNATLANKQILLTSIGLVLNAFAISGIMIFRVKQYITDEWPFVWGIVLFYVVLAVGNFLFILSASLGGNLKMLKTFLVVSGLWTLYVLIASTEFQT